MAKIYGLYLGTNSLEYKNKYTIYSFFEGNLSSGNKKKWAGAKSGEYEVKEELS